MPGECTNHLLQALRDEDSAVIAPLLRRTHLPAGAMLYHPGDTIEQCYFPCGKSIASFFVVMENGHAIETAMVGREGALGGIVSDGKLPAFARASVLHGGDFLKIGLADLNRIKEARPSVERLFSRYADCFIAQVFQSVACNAAHSIEQRAARWLGAAIERTGTSTIAMTQDQLAGLLGVGRSYASRVLRGFRHEDLVATHRGAIEVLDADGLRQLACECNDLIHAHFDEVLRGVYPE